MKLQKVIVTLLCSVLFLVACSSLSKEDYLNAAAKESSNADGDLEKIDDNKLSIDEKKKYIENRVSILKETKNLSAPSEFKEVHKEYVKILDLEIKALEKAKGNLNSKDSILDVFSDDERMEYFSYHNTFKNLLDEKEREIFLKKRTELVDK
ncbi:hypothetical protein OOG41_28110 [Bacillus sp. AS_5]|uniref:hypothetical protein n=1 Tax=unclassified Bacillus (in: firmicutes) TaxID=185979 RepID=UPI00224B8EEF|nr:hypothetical protein [Bacillus sp. AS_3]MCW4657489.1 hypothetical protein [Bacillus sp. AS_3]MCX2704947.1 hypothetical protein [Bacillus sp. AS_5]